MQNDGISAAIRRAKLYQTRGNLRGAQDQYRKIVSFLLGDHAPEDDGDYAAIVDHQMGSLSALDKNAQSAREFFKSSLGRSKKPLTKAVTLRDWSNFELLSGNIDEAKRLHELAMTEFTRPEAQGELPESSFVIEQSVTASFRSRIALVEGIDRKTKYLAVLRTLDIKLETEGSTRDHDVYRLANLGWIIDATESKIDREAYVQKAIVLAKTLKNVQKLHQYQAFLIGGDSLRSAYNVVGRVTASTGSLVGAISRRFM